MIIAYPRSTKEFYALLCNWAVPAFVVFTILWRGGKSLEATWLLVGITFLTLLLYWWNRPEEDTVPAWLWIVVMCFIVWTLLSFGFSTTQNYGLDEVLRTTSLGLLFFWVIRSKNPSVRRNILIAIGIAALLACGIGILVYVLQPVNRFVGTFFDYRFHTDYWPNAWAQFLLLSWPLVAWPVLTSKRPLSFLMRLVILGLLLSCLLLSYSRGAMIALSGQIALLGMILFLRVKTNAPWKHIATGLLIVFLVGFGFFALINGVRTQYYDVQSVSDKVSFQSAEGLSSVSERAAFWSQATTLAKEKPLLGWGPYSFRFVQTRFQDGILRTSDHPHNVFLKFAMERGLPAAVFFAILVASVLALALRKACIIEEEKTIIPFSAFLLVSLAGVLAHNLIDFNLQFVGIALPFWLVLAVLFSKEAYPKSKKLNTKFVQFVEISLVSSMMLVAVWEGGFLILSSFGRHAEARGDVSAALVWYKWSQLELFSRDLHLSRAKLFLEKGNAEAASKSLSDYALQNSEDLRLWKQEAEVEVARGNYDAALPLYERAYSLGRYNDIGIALGYTKALLAANRRDELDAKHAEFVTLLSKYADAIESNTHFIALSPNVETVIEMLELFAKLYPNEAPSYYVLAARVDFHARKERERIESRSPGYLW